MSTARQLAMEGRLPDELRFLLFDDDGITLGEYAAIRDDDPLYMRSYRMDGVYCLAPRRLMYVRSAVAMERQGDGFRLKNAMAAFDHARRLEVADLLYLGVKHNRFHLIGVRQAITLHIDGRGDMSPV